jgi:hypothetical protein
MLGIWTGSILVAYGWTGERRNISLTVLAPTMAPAHKAMTTIEYRARKTIRP